MMQFDRLPLHTPLRRTCNKCSKCNKCNKCKFRNINTTIQEIQGIQGIQGITEIREILGIQEITETPEIQEIAEIQGIQEIAEIQEIQEIQGMSEILEIQAAIVIVIMTMTEIEIMVVIVTEITKDAMKEETEIVMGDAEVKIVLLFIHSLSSFFSFLFFSSSSSFLLQLNLFSLQCMLMDWLPRPSLQTLQATLEWSEWLKLFLFLINLLILVWTFHEQTDKKTKLPMIHIYTDKETGNPKGDATITYEDPAAADSAVSWFNGS